MSNPKKKVIVADKISSVGVAWLKQQPGIEIVEAQGCSAERLLELVGDASAILVRSETKITRAILEAAPCLVAVGRAGVGVDNIDVEAATERGVIVMNTPSGNTIATAELTFTHLLCCARPVPAAAATMRAGKWDRKNFSGTELFGKTLGILGLGRIGTEVAKRALAFGMKVLAYDPYLTEDRAQSLGIQTASRDDVFTNADYITVHMPLTEQTANMVDGAAIARMKRGVHLVNVARGGLIDERALAEALQSGQVASAGFDVFTQEPLPADSPLRAIPNLTLTPHLGASTSEAQESVGIEVAQAVAQVLAGGPCVNAVNMPSVDQRSLQQLRPFLHLAEKLGTLVQQLTTGAVKKLRITYWGNLAEFDTTPVSRAVQRGYLRRISGHVNDVNAPHFIKRLGIEVNVTQSNEQADYKDLIEVEAVGQDGSRHGLTGTIIGTSHSPRIVRIGAHPIEFHPQDTLLISENLDRPGIVGDVGTILGSAGINIANMSLSKALDAADSALAVYQLSGTPDALTLEKIKKNPALLNVLILEA
ncbi:MAG: phosphoglycerate dehydrogenase [Puniceicoccales bacterium]|jgi:D-3-phosphoglycerate dehydrogenase|nr:phosphoglycerate dehydrogenase [Puniceicoccales bacterium]